MIEEKIAALLQKKFEEERFSDCFLIDLKLHQGKKLEVFIDCDSGVTFEKCQRISRYLEEHLDASGSLGENYTLEVSSPGISRPLLKRRQYPKNIGRKIEVNLREGDKKTGTLIAVDEEGITLEEKIRRKVGKKKKTELVQTKILFEDIKHTIVKITF